MKPRIFFVWVDDRRLRIAAERMSDAKRIALNMYGIPSTPRLLRALRAVEANINDIETD